MKPMNQKVLHRGPGSLANIPPYKRIKQHIVNQIASGALGPGDRVASEHELAAQFEVSRLTAHRALRELAYEGHLERVHGLGTFVQAKSETSSELSIYNIAEEVRASGRSFSTVVCRLEEIPVPSDVAKAMNLPEKSRIFHSLIVYRADEIPIQLEDRYVNLEFAPEYISQNFKEQSSTDYLQRISPATQTEQIIEARLPNPDVKKLLKIRENEACLLVIRTTWLNNLITTYTRFTHPGSRRRLINRTSPANSTGSSDGEFFGLLGNAFDRA